MRGCSARSWPGGQGVEMAGSSRAARLVNVPVIGGRSCRAVRSSPEMRTNGIGGAAFQHRRFFLRSQKWSASDWVRWFVRGGYGWRSAYRDLVGGTGSFFDRCSWVTCLSRGATASLSRGCSRRHRRSAAVRLQARARTCDVSAPDRIRCVRAGRHGVTASPGQDAARPDLRPHPPSPSLEKISAMSPARFEATAKCARCPGNGRGSSHHSSASDTQGGTT